MEKVEFMLINGKTRLVKRKLAEVLQKRGKGEIIVEHEEDVLASEAVRQEADALGVQLSAVQGSGKDGRILKRDLRAYDTRMLKAD